MVKGGEFMNFYVDSADIEEIERAVSLGFVQGVTTNPTLLKNNEVWKGFKNIKSFYSKLLDMCEGEIFIQIPSNGYREIIMDLKELDVSRIVIKIPSVPSNVKNAVEIADLGYSVCATAVYTPTQAAVWSSVGIDYVAVYIDRMERDGMNSAETLSAMMKALAKGRTKIIAASLKNLTQVNTVISQGVDHLTAGYDLLKEFMDSEFSSRDTKIFDSDAAEFLKKMKRK